MVMIPVNTRTTEYEIESRQYGGGFGRPYLGMSGLGHECLAALWYGFHWTSVSFHDARKERIFRRGDLEEERVIADLKSVGVEVFRREGDKRIELYGRKDEPQEELVGFAAHAKGHTDGRCIGLIEAPKTEHLLEIKTMKNSKFQELLDNGLEAAFPGYDAQLNRYMKAMGLKRAFFVATNKDDERRKYLRIEIDNEKAEELVRKEQIVIMSEKPLPKAFPEGFYKCGWCAHSNTCHYGKPPEMNCRTCSRHNILEEGKWECELSGKELSEKEQRDGCKMYSRLF